MNVEVSRLPESQMRLVIELTPEEVDEALERAYKRLVQRVSVPGFRKGKAPRAVVERMVGEDSFRHEATDEAMRWGYRKAVDQENIDPIDQADVSTPEGSHDHIEPGEPFTFEATVAVKPEVQLPDYKSLHIERQVAEVADKDIDSLLEEIRQRNATLEPTIQTPEIGDVLTMNLTARVDGNEVINDENFEFELLDEEDDQRTPLPGLSKEVVGANRGDIREVALPLPPDYPEEALAGKTMLVRALIKEVKRKVLPPLDDELAQSVSTSETLEQLRDVLRNNLQLERAMEADEQAVRDAIEEVSSKTFVEIPPVLIEEEIDQMVGDMRSAFERRQLNFEMFLQSGNKTEADIRNDMREQAISNVKTSLIVGTLADAEKIDVSNDEINAALEELLRSGSLSRADARRLRSSSSARTSLRNRLRRQKAIRRLVSIMTGEDVSAEAAEAVADDIDAPAEENVPEEIGV